MSEYQFELTFQLGDEESAEDFVDTLFEAGCDDALIGHGRRGILALEFEREAHSAVDAVRSAIQQVKSAVPHATLMEVGPDLVGLTDLGETFGVSRQYMRNFIVHSHDAPPPVHSGNPALWRYSEVLSWMKDRGITVGKTYPSDQILEISKVSSAYNIAKQLISYTKASRLEVPQGLAHILSEDDLRDIA